MSEASAPPPDVFAPPPGVSFTIADQWLIMQKLPGCPVCQAPHPKATDQKGLICLNCGAEVPEPEGEIRVGAVLTGWAGMRARWYYKIGAFLDRLSKWGE